MKVRYLVLLLILHFLAGCGASDNKNKTNTEVITPNKEEDAVNKSEMILETENKIKKVIDYYLVVKNSLLVNDTESAALSGARLADEIKTVNPKWIEEQGLTIFSTYGNTAEFYAKQISSSKGKIAEQKWYFEQMCFSVINLAKTFGSNKPLYKKFCSVFNNGKGGYWLSDVSTPENPFYNNSRLTCVKTVETVKL